MAASSRAPGARAQFFVRCAAPTATNANGVCDQGAAMRSSTRAKPRAWISAPPTVAMVEVVYYRNPHGHARIGISSDADADDRFGVPSNASRTSAPVSAVSVRRDVHDPRLVEPARIASAPREAEVGWDRPTCRGASVNR